MTLVNKNSVKEYFHRKLGRDPFSSRELKKTRTRAVGLHTHRQHKRLRRRSI